MNATHLRNLAALSLLLLTLGCTSMGGFGRRSISVDSEEARLDELNERIRTEADPRPYRFAYAWHLIRTGDPEESATKLIEGGIHNTDPRTLTWISLLHDDEKEMLEYAGRALAASPRDPDALYASARAHYASGDFEMAEEEIHKHLERDMTSKRGWILRFLIEAWGGHRDRAIESAEQIARNGFFVERRISGEDWVRLAGLYHNDPKWTSSFDRLRALSRLESPNTADEHETGYPRQPESILRRPIDERPYFGLEVGTNSTKISAVHAGSIAEAAGVAAGDVLISINQFNHQAGGNLREAENEINDGDPVTISIERDGSSLELTAIATTWLDALEDAAEALADADKAFSEGQYLKAEDHYRRADAIVRGKTTGVVAAAIWSRFHKGEEAEAVAEVQQLLGQYPEDSRLMTTLAKQQYLMNNPKAAQRVVLHLGDRFPYSGQVPAYRGLIALAEGHKDQAWDLAEQASLMGDGGWALDRLRDELAPRSRGGDGFARQFFQGLAIGLLAASTSGSGSASSASYMPSGPGITQPDPVGDQVFSNSISAWY